MEEVRKRLKKYFEFKGWSNAFVARKLETTTQNVGYFLKNGDYKTSMIKKLFRDDNINLYWLYFGTGEMERGGDLDGINVQPDYITVERYLELLEKIEYLAGKVIQYEEKYGSL